jgi:hypothetical protein
MCIGRFRNLRVSRELGTEVTIPVPGWDNFPFALLSFPHPPVRLPSDVVPQLSPSQPR